MVSKIKVSAGATIPPRPATRLSGRRPNGSVAYQLAEAPGRMIAASVQHLGSLRPLCMLDREASDLAR